MSTVVTGPLWIFCTRIQIGKKSSGMAMAMDWWNDKKEGSGGGGKPSKKFLRTCPLLSLRTLLPIEYLCRH